MGSGNTSGLVGNNLRVYSVGLVFCTFGFLQAVCVSHIAGLTLQIGIEDKRIYVSPYLTYDCGCLVG